MCGIGQGPRVLHLVGILSCLYGGGVGQSGRGCHIEFDTHIEQNTHSYKPPWAEEQGTKELKTQAPVTLPQQPDSRTALV